MAKSSNRLVSLDIFRGLTITFMIIVNAPGSWDYVYPPLRHSSWHGCTPTDLVFPFFLFIVGVAMWFSFRKYGHEINAGSLLRISRRTLAIFAIGILLAILSNLGRGFSTLRIMGVLQRIALAYGIASLICLTVRRDYLWIVTAAMLIIYWVLLALFGGAEPYGLETNLVREIDIAILGESHLYTEYGIPFDPEGLLSTLPSICTVIIGYFTGEILGKGTASGKTVLKLLLYGASSTGLGLLWSLLFPINKPIWTSSYVLYTAGLAMIVLAVIYFLADVLKFRKWGTFFTVFGINALFSYILAGVLAGLMYIIKIQPDMNVYSWFYEKLCVPVAGNINGSLMFALIQMLIVWMVALVLYRKKIMIKL